MTVLDEIIKEVESYPNPNKKIVDLLEKLIEARKAMPDPENEDAAFQVYLEQVKQFENDVLSEEEPDNSDSEFMTKTAAAIEAAFDHESLKVASKNCRIRGLIQYVLNFSFQDFILRVNVILEDTLKGIRIYAILPFVGEKTYEYLLCKAIADANKCFIYGAFKYDHNNGEITYVYNISIENGFNRDDFINAINIVVSTAVNEDAYPAIKKAAQGRYKRAEREEILKSLAPLVEDLND